MASKIRSLASYFLGKAIESSHPTGSCFSVKVDGNSQSKKKKNTAKLRYFGGKADGRYSYDKGNLNAVYFKSCINVVNFQERI